jgi:hypothetical protein
VLGKSAYAERTSKTHHHIIYELNIPYWKDKEKNKSLKEPLENTSNKKNLNLNLNLKNGDLGSSVLESGVRYVRLIIHAPATEWGSSIWRLQIWGYEANQ